MFKRRRTLKQCPRSHYPRLPQHLLMHLFHSSLFLFLLKFVIIFLNRRYICIQPKKKNQNQTSYGGKHYFSAPFLSALRFIFQRPHLDLMSVVFGMDSIFLNNVLSLLCITYPFWTQSLTPWKWSIQLFYTPLPPLCPFLPHRPDMVISQLGLNGHVSLLLR